MSLTTADRQVSFLHPSMRARVARVMADIDAAGLPLRVFEAWRSPERQRYLFAQGRTRPGRIITYARAWESYHQYGLAVDIVGYVDGNWTWNLSDAVWSRMHAIGASHGLERLGFETPHLQLADLRISDLMDGNWPDGNDTSWFDNLADAISRWDGEPEAPPLQTNEPVRPALRDSSRLADLDWSQTPRPGASDWHSHFGGQEWRHDGDGVYLRAAPTQPLRTRGVPTTCLKILDLFGPAIHKASLDHQIAPELIVMTIATETGFARNSDFTGPKTFRWEPHVEVTDHAPPTFGDYSAGPMQTLASTARDVIRRLHLAYPDPFAVAPYYERQPEPAPADNPLYAGGPNVDIGSAEIRSRLGRTGQDPILVAAAYNAGGLYQSNLNNWHLRSSNDHLDRAATWFGDACFVLSAFR